MNKVSNILICMVISLLFLCGVGSAAFVRCGENGIICPGQSLVCADQLLIKNTTVFDLEAGEEQDIQIDFHRPFCLYDYGTGNVSYSISDTPLNVTVPSGFIAIPARMNYPGVIRVRADSKLPSGNYSFNLRIHGARGIGINSLGEYDFPEFFVNVKNEHEDALFYQQVSLAILFLLSVLAIIILYYRRRRGKN